MRATHRHINRAISLACASSTHHTGSSRCAAPVDLHRDINLHQEVVALRREVATLRASLSGDLDIIELRGAVARLQIELGAARDALRLLAPVVPRAHAAQVQFSEAKSSQPQPGSLASPDYQPGGPEAEDLSPGALASPLTLWYGGKQKQHPKDASPIASPSQQAAAPPTQVQRLQQELRQLLDVRTPEAENERKALCFQIKQQRREVARRAERTPGGSQRSVLPATAPQQAGPTEAPAEAWPPWHSGSWQRDAPSAWSCRHGYWSGTA